MKWDSAPGPDGISAFVLKEHKEAMKVPLYYIRRMSLDRGKSPDGVNQSLITPTFKGRNRSTPKDYRPVALTTCIYEIVKISIFQFFYPRILILQRKMNLKRLITS